MAARRLGRSCAALRAAHSKAPGLSRTRGLFAGRKPGRERTRLSDGQLWFNYGTSALGLLGLAELVYAFRDRPLNAMRFTGLVLLGLSGALFLLARVQLGRAFRLRARAELLVTHGLYARIRNPIYLFGTLVLAGACLWIERPWLLFALVPVALMQRARARREEQVLAAHFGTAYEEYKRRTWL